MFPLFILSSLPKKNKAKSRYVQTKKNPISLILARPFLRIKHWGKSVIKEVLSIYLNSFLRQKRYPKCSLEIYTWPTYLILTMIYSNSLLLKRWLICLFAFPSTLWQLSDNVMIVFWMPLISFIGKTFDQYNRLWQPNQWRQFCLLCKIFLACRSLRQEIVFIFYSASLDKRIKMVR